MKDLKNKSQTIEMLTDVLLHVIQAYEESAMLTNALFSQSQLDRHWSCYWEVGLMGIYRSELLKRTPTKFQVFHWACGISHAATVRYRLTPRSENRNEYKQLRSFVLRVSCALKRLLETPNDPPREMLDIVRVSVLGGYSDIIDRKLCGLMLDESRVMQDYWNRITREKRTGDFLWTGSASFSTCTVSKN